MGLFLLSETNQPSDMLRQKLASEISQRGGLIAYISSAPQDENRSFFEETKANYANITPNVSLEYFDLSERFTDEQLSSIANFPIVHLSGGNTYVFVEALRRRGISAILTEVVDNNGLIIGVSAGAIALTQNIDTSAFCGDPNIPALTDMSGMRFVDFCFLPHLGTHFEDTPDNRAKAQEFANATGKTLYVGRDSEGIFVDQNGQTQYGDLLKLDPKA